MKTFRNSAHYKPNTVQIELVQGCNRQCAFCGSNGFERKVHCIELDVLRRECKLIQESGYNPRILLAGHGEPTLHPNFYDCIKVMREELPNTWIQIMTNGFSIRKDLNHIVRMFEAGINDVSLDEYKDNLFDEEAIQEVLKTYTGATVDLQRMKSGVPLYLPKTSKNRRLLIIPAIDESEINVSRKLTNHCGAALPPNTKLSHTRCSKIFRELSFRWDGWVAICCQDFRGQYPVINCMDEAVSCFDDIWRHPRLESARRILYHDKRVFFPCNICDSPAIRPGLLPDHRAKESMEQPTSEDYAIVNEKHDSLAIIRKREWES